MDSFLEDGENCILYELKKMEELPGKIGEYLSDTEKLQKMADRGFELAKNGHTWADRARVLETVLENL